MKTTDSTGSAWALAPLSGTGRTGRMLQYVAEEAAKGKNLIVVATTMAYARLLSDRYIEQFGEPVGRVQFLSIRQLYHVDLLTLRVSDGVRDTEYVFDHATLEVEAQSLLRMLHRFDEKSTT